MDQTRPIAVLVEAFRQDRVEIARWCGCRGGRRGRRVCRRRSGRRPRGGRRGSSSARFSGLGRSAPPPGCGVARGDRKCGRDLAGGERVGGAGLAAVDGEAALLQQHDRRRQGAKWMRRKRSSFMPFSERWTVRSMRVVFGAIDPPTCRLSFSTMSPPPRSSSPAGAKRRGRGSSLHCPGRVERGRGWLRRTGSPSPPPASDGSGRG